MLNQAIVPEQWPGAWDKNSFEENLCRLVVKTPLACRQVLPFADGICSKTIAPLIRHKQTKQFHHMVTYLHWSFCPTADSSPEIKEFPTNQTDVITNERVCLAELFRT